MDEQDLLAERFERHRPRLRAVAYRVLGSAGEAEDAVQEAWLRLSRSGAGEVENLGGWLTTVVARVSLDMLRSRTTRREDSWEAHRPEAATRPPDEATGPEQQAVLADSVGLALLVVLDTLAPAERLAFVLHDMFAVPYDEIAPVVERTPAAARQLASRARRRVRSVPGLPETDVARQREVVDAFLAAARGGDFGALLALLDPEAELSTDAAAALAGVRPAHGAAAVAETFVGRAKAAQPALIGGTAGLVWAPGGAPRVVFGFTIRDDRVVAIELLADAERIGRLDLELLAG
ncbi:sigma-70 family RNA polymerase sigma factor [Streptomyces sioyaensis]|uniref:sigma-70 family RNA polymerase sigma factor n=1 Tax=Streptomyces sioyaensis TaxID=67364 RepID=UPI001F1B9508|nr:sigma-70 family RNA polymerase sigma factor [Streptomyces sioyaensis]MCF3177347.1 sigma-70 family RNA polymerase sigma factor [Streptomyces sioyaensis]